MSEWNLKIGDAADHIRLRPEDIAILVFAAEQLIRTVPDFVTESMPHDCITAVENVAARRIELLIRALEKSRSSDTGRELMLSIRFGDRMFFAEVL